MTHALGAGWSLHSRVNVHPSVWISNMTFTCPAVTCGQIMEITTRFHVPLKAFQAASLLFPPTAALIDVC